MGLCKAGAQTCAAGTWGACSGEVKPAAEACDNKDNNCDGKADDNLSKTCYSGPKGTQGVGMCKAGVRTCSSGSWGQCAGQVVPGKEACATKDIDCDGSSLDEESWCGLQAYYRYEDSSSSLTVSDSSGNNYHGYRVSSGGPVKTTGISGDGLKFDGKDDWVVVGNKYKGLDISKGITMEAWVNVAASTYDHQVIIGKWWTSNCVHKRAHVFEFQPDGRTLQIVLYGITTDGYGNASSSVKINFNTWYHVAGTYDGKVARVYVNGKQTGSRTTSGMIPVTAAPLSLGAHSCAPDGNYFFGMMDNVRIYNKALSPSLIMWHYKNKL